MNIRKVKFEEMSVRHVFQRRVSEGKSINYIEASMSTS